MTDQYYTQQSTDSTGRRSAKRKLTSPSSDSLMTPVYESLAPYAPTASSWEHSEHGDDGSSDCDRHEQYDDWEQCDLQQEDMTNDDVYGQLCLSDGASDAGSDEAYGACSADLQADDAVGSLDHPDVDSSEHRCCVCFADLSDLLLLDRELHINDCLDGRSSQAPEPLPKAVCTQCGTDISGYDEPARQHHFNTCLAKCACTVCGVDISGYDEPARQYHLNACLDEIEVSAALDTVKAVPVTPVQKAAPDPATLDKENSNSITAAGYTCRICGLDLAAKSLTQRLGHVKKCGAAQGVTPQDLRPVKRSANTQAATAAKQAPIDSFFRRPPRDALKLLMQGARNQTSATAKAASEPAQSAAPSVGRGRGSGRATDLTGRGRGRAQLTGPQKASRCPDFKKVHIGAGCPPIIVDGFHYAAKELSTCYFLTHMHSDHYGGITRRWEHGTIYATPATAKLLSHRLKVSRFRLMCVMFSPGLTMPELTMLRRMFGTQVSNSFIIVIPMHTPTSIRVGNTSVRVTMLDANHCPGAAMVRRTVAHSLNTSHAN